MEYIEVKINLENYTVRNIPESLISVNADGKIVVDTNSPLYYYGQIPDYKIYKDGEFILNTTQQKITNTININVFLKQNYDDLGIFTDLNFTPKTTMETIKPLDFNPMVDGRVPGYPVSFYYSGPITSTGVTLDYQLKAMSSLRVDPQTNLPIFKDGLNVSGDKKNIFSGVISKNQQEIKYLLGGKKDTSGNLLPNTGVEYITYFDTFIKFKNEFGESNLGNKTIFTTNNGGWGPDNLSLAALVKEEELLGIVFKPEISSDVFINRGVADIFERHAILSELKTTQDIDTMRGGYISNE